MADPEISVVMAVQDRAEALPTLLSCLERQHYPAAGYEVVIAPFGDNQGDESVVLRHAEGAPMSVRCVLGADNEVEAKNLGARFAEGAWVLFLDQDLIVGPDLVGAHVRAQEAHDGKAVVQGGAVRHPDLPRGALTRWFMSQDKALMNPEQPDVPLYWSSRHCSLPRRHFLGEGGFNAELAAPRAADIELASRIRQWHLAMVGLPGKDALIWRAVRFQDERRRFLVEGHALCEVVNKAQVQGVEPYFNLSCSQSRHWLDTLFAPFYIRACDSAEMDIRVHGQSCRRIFNYERRRGYTLAQQGLPLPEVISDDAEGAYLFP